MICPKCHHTEDPCYCEESKPVLSIVLDTILKIEDLPKVFSKKSEGTLLDLAFDGRERFIQSLRYAVRELRRYEPARPTSPLDVANRQAEDSSHLVTNKLGDVITTNLFAQRLLEEAKKSDSQNFEISKMRMREIESEVSSTLDTEIRDQMLAFVRMHMQSQPAGMIRNVQVAGKIFNMTADTIGIAEVGAPGTAAKMQCITIGGSIIPWHEIDVVTVQEAGPTMQPTTYTFHAPAIRKAKEQAAEIARKLKQDGGQRKIVGSSLRISGKWTDLGHTASGIQIMKKAEPNQINIITAGHSVEQAAQVGEMMRQNLNRITKPNPWK